VFSGLGAGKTLVLQEILMRHPDQLTWDELNAIKWHQNDVDTWKQLDGASEETIELVRRRLAMMQWMKTPLDVWGVVGDAAQPAPHWTEVRGRRSFVMLLGVFPREFLQEFGGDMIAHFMERARQEKTGYVLWLLRELVGIAVAAICLRLDRSPMRRYAAVGGRAVDVRDYVPTGHCCGNDPCRCAAIED
jgi:hypothetical protein